MASKPEQRGYSVVCDVTPWRIGKPKPNLGWRLGARKTLCISVLGVWGTNRRGIDGDNLPTSDPGLSSF